ncbi:uncharacterized protein LOC112563091 [Pomacea canaliculata]|uniref:uncharacterized protein LOC112563091 n=1 Tax=Pomacea canaliculata TaxID=400727 RepID=UPI000D73C4C9|nr:uncharacterized protein LOC112563091 [Pomacea canaliculata]
MEKYYDDNDDEPTWEDLADCLNNTADLDKLCRLQVEQPLCHSVEIESKTEKLFNTKLRTLHCYCEGLSPGLSRDRSALIGWTCGGVLAVMMLLVVIAVLHIRKRKRKSRLQSEAQRSANVTSSADDTLSTYEIVDDHFQGPNSWSERIKSWHSRDQATSGLPPRDLSYQPPHTTSSGDHHSEDSAPDIVFLSPRQGLPAPHL